MESQEQLSTTWIGGPGTTTGTSANKASFAFDTESTNTTVDSSTRRPSGLVAKAAQFLFQKEKFIIQRPADRFNELPSELRRAVARRRKKPDGIPIAEWIKAEWWLQELRAYRSKLKNKEMFASSARERAFSRKEIPRPTWETPIQERLRRMRHEKALKQERHWRTYLHSDYAHPSIVRYRFGRRLRIVRERSSGRNCASAVTVFTPHFWDENPTYEVVINGALLRIGLLRLGLLAVKSHTIIPETDRNYLWVVLHGTGFRPGEKIGDMWAAASFNSNAAPLGGCVTNLLRRPSTGTLLAGHDSRFMSWEHQQHLEKRQKLRESYDLIRGFDSFDSFAAFVDDAKAVGVEAAAMRAVKAADKARVVQQVKNNLRNVELVGNFKREIITA